MLSSHPAPHASIEKYPGEKYPSEKWLAIVGIGEGGITGLGEAARQAISEAAIVFGGHRHLTLAASLISGAARAWPSPFDQAIAEILALKGQRICVLASGDPFHYGVGATLARHVDAAEMLVFSAPGAFSLAASRLGWPLQEVDTISLHGRPIDLIRPLLQPGNRILVLTSDGKAPAQIARLLDDAGFGPSPFHVLEALGGSREKSAYFAANTVGDRLFDDLNLVAIEAVAAPDARIPSLGTGLAETLFEHDGQITKPEVRAITLAALQPRRGALLWDIGAGSGSISIEWMRAHPSLRTIAVERDAKRAARIGRNALSFGVPGLRIVEGSAPDALADLPTPDAIFIGGGGSRSGVADAAIAALRSGGRLVANAVTLEMEALLLSLHARLGGELVGIGISHLAAVGTMSALRPALPVTQWRWEKP